MYYSGNKDNTDIFYALNTYWISASSGRAFEYEVKFIWIKNGRYNPLLLNLQSVDPLPLTLLEKLAILEAPSRQKSPIAEYKSDSTRRDPQHYRPSTVSATTGADDQKVMLIIIAYVYQDVKSMEEIRQIIDIISLQKKHEITIICKPWEVAINTELETENLLERSHLAILIITKNFLRTSYCYSQPLIDAVKCHPKERYILPLLFQGSASGLLDGTPFAKLVIKPEGKAINERGAWRDRAINYVTEEIKEAIKRMQKKL